MLLLSSKSYISTYTTLFPIAMIYSLSSLVPFNLIPKRFPSFLTLSESVILKQVSSPLSKK